MTKLGRYLEKNAVSLTPGQKDLLYFGLTTGGGAGIGATLDKGNRRRGALVGGLTGAGGHSAGFLKPLEGVPKETANILKGTGMVFGGALGGRTGTYINDALGKLERQRAREKEAKAALMGKKAFQIPPELINATRSVAPLLDDTALMAKKVYSKIDEDFKEADKEELKKRAYEVLSKNAAFGLPDVPGMVGAATGEAVMGGAKDMYNTGTDWLKQQGTDMFNKGKDAVGGVLKWGGKKVGEGAAEEIKNQLDPMMKQVQPALDAFNKVPDMMNKGMDFVKSNALPLAAGAAVLGGGALMLGGAFGGGKGGGAANNKKKGVFDSSPFNNQELDESKWKGGVKSYS